jgi:aminoglycoside N3'-acetyltransferase
MNTKHPKEGIVEDLRELGVDDGDVVMVHASIRRIGPVDGGADGLIDALQRAVGTTGTLLMVLGARQVGDEPFAASTTPADPDVGVLAEVFRTRPGVVVNDHPDGRFGAWGHHADELAADGPWDHYYGPGSALERLVQRRGKVLRLGADDNTITLTHHAEALARLDVPKRTVRRRHRIVRDGRFEEVIVETIDDSDGIADYDLTGRDPSDFPPHAVHDDGRIDEFAVILADARSAGLVATGTVGGAVGELLDAAAFVDFAVDWIEAHVRA